jgi:gluconate 2-dehydrogenase
MSTTSDGDKPRILVARKIFPEGLARLEPVFDIDYNEADAIDAPETLRRKLIGKAGAIVTGSETIDSAALAVAKDLKIVANMMVGFNNLNLKALSEAGVMATNTPDVLTETTADLAFGLLLSAARRMAESEHWLRAGQWQKWSLDQWMGNEVYGTTLGVLGKTLPDGRSTHKIGNRFRR